MAPPRTRRAPGARAARRRLLGGGAALAAVAALVLGAETGASGASVRVLGDADLARADRLAGLDVIVLPYVAAMDLRQRRVLAAYVRAGGGLVGLYFAGRDDERGRP